MALSTQLVEEGGYDYEFVKKFEEIEDEDLVCPVCQLVCRDPQQSECCGKVFCKVCVDNLVLSSPSELCCPNCREKSISFFADKRTSRSIFSLKVYCLEKNEGCDWQGSLREAECHSEKCGFKSDDCPNDCGQKLQRRHMVAHLESQCFKRTVKCADCNRVGQWMYIVLNHSEECPEKKICCENGC